MAGRPQTSQELATAMLEQFGPEGEHWLRRQLYDPASGRACLHGAAALLLTGYSQYMVNRQRLEVERLLGPIAAVAKDQFPHRALGARHYGAANYLEAFNDNSSWDDVRVVLEKVAAG
jgi:hypothetical protein